MARTRPKEPPIRLRTPTNLATAITSITALGLAAAGVAPVAAQNPDSHARPAVIRGQDTWYLNDELAGGAAENSYTYGNQDSIHVMGDWDGDGVSTPGVIRPAGDVSAEGEVALNWYLRNSNTPGPADEVVTFGHADNPEDFDTPVVGDWDGDGRDTVGVVIPDYDTNEFVWKLANDHANATVDVEFRYGEPHAYGTFDPREYRQVPVVGDWDGDGVDGPGVVGQDPGDQPSIWHLRDAPDAGPADHVFPYGRSDDRLVTGDWDGDGRDTPGVIRTPHWYVANDLDGGVADEHFAYGRATDEPIVWETTTSGEAAGSNTTAWTQDEATLSGSATAREPATLAAMTGHAEGDVDTLDVTFDGDALPDATVRYLDGYPREPGSGREVEMRGNQHLELILEGSQLPSGDVVVDEGGEATPTLAEVRILGEHEGYVHIGVGLSTGEGTAPEVDVRLRGEPGSGVLHLDVRHVS